MNTVGMYQANRDSNQYVNETIAVVLAGGKGTRLGALTRHVCKPALPFGGIYRNIDFSVSNCVNSGLQHIGVATQYKDEALVRHIVGVWSGSGNRRKAFVELWRSGSADGYCGTADAVYRNWVRIERNKPRFVMILAGDHVYKMDYRPMLQRHAALGADVTVGCVEVPIADANQFGVMSVDQTDRIVRFSEKPCHPESLPGHPDRALGSMGIYVFNRESLGALLSNDALSKTSSHDFGCDLIPQLIDKAKVYAYPFTGDAAVGGGYWRDVGTLSAYWHAHMELLDGVPGFTLDDPIWPVWSDRHTLVDYRDSAGEFVQSSQVAHSLLGDGYAIDYATVQRSVLFPNVAVAAGTKLLNAVVLPYAVIGRDCYLNNVIVDAGVWVPDGTTITQKRQHGGVVLPTLVTTETNNACYINERTLRRDNQVKVLSKELLLKTGT